ncbi:MAG: hypothetical protein GY720_16615 [bacterium]|nr:hypothetical protein [bacterium]
MTDRRPNQEFQAESAAQEGAYLLGATRESAPDTVVVQLDGRRNVDR